VPLAATTAETLTRAGLVCQRIFFLAIASLTYVAGTTVLTSTIASPSRTDSVLGAVQQGHEIRPSGRPSSPAATNVTRLTQRRRQESIAKTVRRDACWYIQSGLVPLRLI